MGEVKKDEHGKFAPGTSGGPGRPKGSRNKLTEEFLAAMHEDFKAHGKTAIQQARADKPTEYLKIISTIIPKHAEIKINEYDELSDDKLRASLSAALRDLGSLGVDIGLNLGQGDDNQDQTGQPEPVRTLQ